MIKESTQNKKWKHAGFVWGTLLFVLSVIAFFGTLASVCDFSEKHSDELGKASLQQVSNQVQKMLYNSKLMLSQFASDIEIFLERGADLDEIQAYLKRQSRIFKDQTGKTFMNAFVFYTPDCVLNSDSQVPEGFNVREREWYQETMQRGIGVLYVIPPYIDAFTNKMCITATTLLSNGQTVIGLDFLPFEIQEFVADMKRSDKEDALIVNQSGIIVGYSDNSLVGEKIDEALPEYMNVYNRLLNGKNNNLVLKTPIKGQMSKVFCNRSGEWMLIYKVKHSTIFDQPQPWVILSWVSSFLLNTGVFLCFLFTYRNKQEAEAVLQDRKSFWNGVSEKVHGSLIRIIRESESTEEGQQNDVLKRIEESALDLSDIIKSVLSDKDPHQKQEKRDAHKDEKDILATTKRVRNIILIVMLAAIALAIVFTGLVLNGWGKDRMEREVALYNYQLDRWATKQLQTLNMFVDTIAANPSVLDDYNFTVEYLDRIVKKNPEISAAYIVRPGHEHEMTMNNGWIPKRDYVAMERQWYINTHNSPKGICITPIIDARTGLYCVTFSRIIKDLDTGEQIGTFALDFYIENVTSILESSYSEDGYAFLTDKDELIINHPNLDYQVSSGKTTSILETGYGKTLNNSDIHFIKDYDGKWKVCIARTENVSGFTVVAVKDIHTVYGSVLLGGCVFTVLLVICIVLLYQLAMRMILWQENVKQTLKEEAERASKADRAKSIFLAQMSHEIRTPINAVLGMNEMILREAEDPEIMEYASNAYSAGRSLLSIINDVLDISKIEAGRLEIIEAEYELYSLISDCYNMTIERAEKKGLAFNVILNPNLPSWLYGDMFHIRQVIVNLLTNAVKYTDSGNVELHFDGMGKGDDFILCVRVKDTGIGIKPENIGALFNSFQRFDLKRNQSIEGTGLGLSICKQLTELMHGTITVDSEYGKGSLFSCELPQRTVGDGRIGNFSPNHPLARDELAVQQNFTAPVACVLAVDDVAINLMVFSSLLKVHKMQIDTAESGKRCLEMIAEKKYDIIFMDHMMPEMDGIETLEHIKQMDTPNRDTPVVMLTADAISGEKERFLDAGFVAYLTKPIQSQKLEHVILQYLPEEKIVWQDQESREVGTKTETEKSEHKTELKGENPLFSPSLGMAYTGEGEYRKILTAYVKDGESKAKRICDCFAGEDWKNYVIEVHALKSISLTIGARRLSEAARELELAGKAGAYETIKEKHEALIQLYQTVLSLCREFLEELAEREGSTKVQNPAVEEELIETSKETVLEWVNEILAAVEDFDRDTITKICEKAASYSLNGASLKPLFDEIAQAASDFEYDEAAEKAKTVAEKIK